MSDFFKIPNGIANQVGFIEYQPGKAIDLKARKTTVGNHWLLDEETIDLIKANQAAILSYLPTNMHGKINAIINMNKNDHQRLTHAEALAEAEVQTPPV